MANGTLNIAQFPWQRPYERIYRVGTRLYFTTIQSAINQALADGFVSNANPCLIEIYDKGSPYVENLTLSAGIHLKGISEEQNTVPVSGNISWTPGAGGVSVQTVILEKIAITGAASQANITLAGTNTCLLGLSFCSVTRTLNDGQSLVNISNTNAGAVISFFDSQLSVTENVAAGLDLQGGVAKFRGATTYSSLGTSTAVRIRGNATFSCQGGNNSVIATSSDTIVVSGSLFISMESTTGFAALSHANVQVGGANGRMINFASAGAVQLRFCLLRLTNATFTTAKIANDGGSGGTLTIQSCAFFTNGSAPYFAGRNQIDPGLTIVRTTEKLRFNRLGSVTQASVGEGGFPSITDAINFLVARVGANIYAEVLIAPGSYTENITLPNQIALIGLTPQNAVGVKSQVYQELDTQVIINGTVTVNQTGGFDAEFIKNIKISAPAGAPAILTTGAGFGALILQNCHITNDNNNAFATIQHENTNNSPIYAVNSKFVRSNTNTGSLVGGSQKSQFQAENSIFQVNPITQYANVPIFDKLGDTNFEMCWFVAEVSSAFNVVAGTSPQFRKCQINVNPNRGQVWYYLGSAGVEVFNSDFRVFVNPGAVIARDGTQATGTISLTGNVWGLGDSVVINGQAFVNGVDFVVGGTAAATAQNIANAVNTSPAAAILQRIYAIANGVNVELYSWNWAASSNAYTLAVTGTAPAAVSGPTFTGGANGGGGSFNQADCSSYFSLFQPSITTATSQLTPTAIP